jgi:hypothetical protein
MVCFPANGNTGTEDLLRPCRAGPVRVQHPGGVRSVSSGKVHAIGTRRVPEEYKIAGHRDTEGDSETFRLMTRIPASLTCRRARQCISWRREIETAFHELEAELLSDAGFRSKKPDVVEVSHYATRSFTHEAADTVDILPDPIPFTRTLNPICRQVTDPPAHPPKRCKRIVAEPAEGARPGMPGRG